jgi:osmotically-inducible protein OsmY
MRQKLRRKVIHLQKGDWATEEAGAAIKEQPACNVGAGRVAEVREADKKYRFNAPSVPRPTDAEITKAAVDALSSGVFAAHDRIEVKVQNGRLTLLGEVEWPYQRDRIEFAIQGLAGVGIVDNQITTSSQLLTLDDVEASVEKVIHRRAAMGCGDVEVTISGRKILLTGQVRSWAEHEQTWRAAWSMRGVTDVETLITVCGPPEQATVEPAGNNRSDEAATAKVYSESVNSRQIP